MRDLIVHAKNKIGNVDTETLRVLSVPRLLEVFDAQFLHTLFDDFCDVSDSLILCINELKSV